MIFWTSLLLLAFMATTSAASIDTQVYIIHMDKNKVAANHAPAGNYREFYQAMIDSVNDFSPQEEDQDQETSPAELLYVYETVISGFAAKLSTKHLELLKQVDGFLSATPDEILTLHTTHSPRFLSLENGKGLWSATNLASDVIVGVIDTGIWPEHISFQDKGISSVPSKWKGDCEEGTEFSKSNCNKKLIGARAFYKAYEAAHGRIDEKVDYRSPRDVDGHGTHTASTAAGNLVSNASFFGLAKGSAVGMRYKSRIAAYKVCWQPNGNCSSCDILAAIDKAVSDGVDVLSISLGGPSRHYYNDPKAIASFGATQNGVFVSCAAGNSGPTRSTVGNTAPWLMTVAASYMDRSFLAIVKLGNGQVFEGSSLYFGKATKQLPLVYNKTAGGPRAEYCTDGSLNQELVKGKIVVCQTGVISRAKKGEIVKLANGAGMIIVNTDNEELVADPHILPVARLGAAAGNTIKMYVNSTKQATASIVFKGTAFGKTAPVMAAFSSRGPSRVGPDVIKPDVTAPGVNILAAWPPMTSPTGLKTDKRSVLFNIISGTSMSCPHVSGLAALLKSAHQDWSPAAIKSALMTTAYTLNNKNAPIGEAGSSYSLLATPFAFGSGHVDPQSAADPGLIYDITTEDYLNYLCSLNYTSSQMNLFSGGNFTCPQKTTLQLGDLNYPSFAVIFNGNAQSITMEHQRTVTNVGTPTCSYAVQVKQPTGVSVTVKPKILNFKNLGQKLSYKVTFVGLEVPTIPYSISSFGSITWVSGKYTVRSPIAVTWQ